MPPTFLNSREDAVLIWAVIVLAFVIYKIPGLLGSFAYIVWLAIKPPLVFLFGGAALYSAGVLAVADELGVWARSAAKETVYWFLGTGLVPAGPRGNARPDPAYARTLLRRAVRTAIVLDFVVNLYVFPLAVELVLVPLIALLAVVEVVNKEQPEPEPHQPLARLTDRELATLGSLVLVSVLVRIGLHPSARLYGTRSSVCS